MSMRSSRTGKFTMLFARIVESLHFEHGVVYVNHHLHSNSFYFKFCVERKGNKTKQELAFRYYHSSALLTLVAMF